jgi:hypothetical protein
VDVLRPQPSLRRALTVLAVAVTVVPAAAAPAAAQQAAPAARGTFILGVGGGYAATKSDCGNCGSSEDESSGDDGATYDDVGFLSLAALWRVGPKAVAGAEVQLETAREGARVLYLMGTIRFHPWVSRGLFIGAGFGMVQVKSSLSLPDGSDGTGTYRGIGLNYGVGWEFLKNKAISLAPYGAHYVSTLSNVTVGDFKGESVIGNVWVAGLRVFFN